MLDNISVLFTGIMIVFITYRSAKLYRAAIENEKKRRNHK